VPVVTPPTDEPSADSIQILFAKASHGWAPGVLVELARDTEGVRAQVTYHHDFTNIKLSVRDKTSMQECSWP